MTLRPYPLVAPVVALCLVAATPAAAQPGDAATRALVDGYAALERLDVEGAADALALAEALGAPRSDRSLLQAMIELHRGQHRAALAAIAEVDGAGRPGHDALVASIEAGERWMADAHELRSEHFVVRHAADVDVLVAELALAVLEDAHDAVGADLGWYPSEPVLVEIYPTGAAFSTASGLPEAAVANDTIGLCRWNRLLVTSPMAASFGYPWADTLCHEYTHLAVQHLGGYEVPVWLHEGIASFAQRRWRGADPLSSISPAGWRLLADALAADAWVPLEEIGTCLACLDGRDRVRLAFSQVHTMVEFLARSRGSAALVEVIEACAAGADARDAVAAAWGGPWASFEGAWRAWLVERLPETPAAGVLSLGVDEPAGDGMLRAALIEYERAEQRLDPPSPSLAVRVARTRLALDAADAAVAGLEGALRSYPEFEPLWLHLARGRRVQGDVAGALDALREAELLNPFDPRIHAERLELLDAERDAEAHARAVEALRTLAEAGRNR